MTPDLVDVLALLLGIFYGVRRHALRRQGPEAPSGVDAERYRKAYETELRATTLSSSACFIKILLDYGLILVAPRIGIVPTVQWPMAAAIDISWGGVMLVGLYLRSSARRLRRAAETPSAGQN